MDVGNADGGQFLDQVSQAIAFLERHGGEIRRLTSLPDFKVGELDFGIWDTDKPTQTSSFPPVLARLASECGLSLTLTIYTANVR